MDFCGIQRSKQFFLEGREEKEARLYYTNTERSEKEDEDASFDDWSSSLEIARKILQISEKWEQQNFQPSDNSSNKQDNLAANQVMACSSDDAPWKTRDQEIWQSTTSKLKSYGFYESHCVQALIHTDGDLEEALEMLFYKYYNIKDILRIDDSEIPSTVELLKIRQEEKQKLETMFYDAFLEKIENRVWILQLELIYLISSTSISEDSYFTLEIRFPKECIYPYEPPYIYFHKNKGTFPRIKCLRIARRLHEEALLYSLEGIPSMYSVISLLKNENEIQVYLEENREPFLQPFQSLYEKRRQERRQEDESIREFEITMSGMMQQEKEHIVDYCKPPYARQQKKEEENMITSYVHKPLFARRQEKKEENMSSKYLKIFDPLYPLEKREENIIKPIILMSSDTGELEKREENMFNIHAVEPLYAERLEKQEENIANPYIYTLYIHPYMYTCTPYISIYKPLLYVEKTEKREKYMDNIYPSLSNDDFSVINFYKFNSKFEKDEDNALRIEKNSIKKAFISKKKDPKYIKMQKIRKKLPAWSQKDEILEAVDKNQVVIISGETGCGKSTQIPQFILDDWITSDKQHVNIICTQPRKISAIGLAERVAAERTEEVGDVVGYHVRLEKKLSHKTRLTFCTVEILLQKLIADFNLFSKVTHVIVDEVHERSAESDFLLMLLKDWLSKRLSLKIILMSATLNADVFSSYFEYVPVLSIPGYSFPVEQIFLEDAFEKTGYVLDEKCKYICQHKVNSCTFPNLESDFQIRVPFTDDFPEESTKDEDLTMIQLINRYPNYSKQTYKNLYLMNNDEINYDLIEHILEWIISEEHDYPKEGSILIFLPGVSEIIALMEQLKNNYTLSKINKIMIVPLHSSLSNEEQCRVFKKTEDGVRKIVISTNLAETSITINDCVFVIDSGKMRESRFNSHRNMQCLETCWVTRANAMQRKGRAGRVMSGVCIHLYTSHRYQTLYKITRICNTYMEFCRYKYFAEHQIPEILRISLESLLLHIDLLHKGYRVNPYSITIQMLDTPSSREIAGAINRLQDVGAFDLECNLTPLGRHLAKLPVDVRIGKLILYGAIFSCLDDVLTIAACLSYKSPFNIPLEMKDKVRPKLKFFTNNSDHLTMMQAYKNWQTVTYYEGTNAGIKFAERNFLSIHTLYTLVDMKYQFLELLASIGFVPIDLPKKQHNIDNILMITGSALNKNNWNYKLLQSLICAALYPNIVKIKKETIGSQPRIKFETRNDGLVKIHPSSVNSRTKLFSSSFLAYQSKIKINEVFISEVSTVSILSLILFSGYEISMKPRYQNNKNCIISIDQNWVTLAVDWNTGILLKRMKTDLTTLITQKLLNPLFDLSKDPRTRQMIDTIVNTVSNWSDEF